MNTKFYRALAFFAIILLVSSCSTTSSFYRDKQKDLIKAAIDLERVQESQNYSGKITVSDLNFVANKSQFNVNYNEDPSNYVQAARVNISGDASSSIQMAMFAAVAGQVSATAPISAGQPPGTNNPPSNPPSLPNQAETAINSFSTPSALIGLNPTADERDAVEKGINDKLAEDFLEALANPPVDSNSEAIVFGVMQATCEPGQRTKKGFIAEMDISLKYGRHTETKIYSTNSNIWGNVGLDRETKQFITNNLASSTGITNIQGKPYYLVGTNTYLDVQQSPHPSVLAVLPLMDSRNMELQNNNQSQIEIAAALSAAFAAKGLNAAATILSDYVKRQQSNIQTFNSLPVATAYADGSDFGFQLYPAAEAIANPGSSGPAANVLEPVTFPIVVVLKVDKNDLVANTNAPWNMLVTEAQPHWIPIKWGNWHKLLLYTKWFSKGPFALWGDYNFFAYQPDYQLMYRASKLDDAKERLEDLDPQGMQYPQTVPQQYYFQYHQLEIAYDSLKASAISTEAGRMLPDGLFPPNQLDTNAPTITDVFPHTIWRDTNTDILILVKGVKDTNEINSVTIAGIVCSNLRYYAYGYTNYTRAIACTTTSTITTTNLVYSQDGAKITLIQPPFVMLMTNVTISDSGTVTNFGAAGVAILATLPNMFYSVTNSATNNVDFTVIFKDLPPATKTIGLLLQGRSLSDANVTLTRDTNSKLLGIDIKPSVDLTGTNLLKVVNAILQKSEPPPKTVNIIH